MDGERYTFDKHNLAKVCSKQTIAFHQLLNGLCHTQNVPIQQLRLKNLVSRLIFELGTKKFANKNGSCGFKRWQRERDKLFTQVVLNNLITVKTAVSRNTSQF